jgi:hypothetical protein
MTSFHGFYNMETGNNIERTDSITARSFCLQENNRRRKVRTCLFYYPPHQSMDSDWRLPSIESRTVLPHRSQWHQGQKM